MAHISAPQTNVKDGDTSISNSTKINLEEGEIEDGELQEEEGEELANENEDKSPVNISPVKTEKMPAQQDKLNDISVRYDARRKKTKERNKDELGEEWACIVEKKLKAIMNKDVDNERINGAEASDEHLDADDNKTKRKKKHKEEAEEERKEIKKYKPHQGEPADPTFRVKSYEDDAEGDDSEEEDDEEMLYVRGASPVMGHTHDSEKKLDNYMDNGFPFNLNGGKFDEPYDSHNEEGPGFCGRRNQPACDERPRRGRGTKRRQKSVGRNLLHNKNNTRNDTKSKRGMKRPLSRRSNIEKEPNICSFYMQGKCQRGEDCTYSHNICPPRKLELCKFYLMDCCAKKDKCLYMHQEFPCKYFHTGMKCFSGPSCKFSHGHLPHEMRGVLLKHLETAPKGLLGDAPSPSNEGAAEMIYNKKSHVNQVKKIPSLFDVEVAIPDHLLAKQKNSSRDQSPRTSMRESDNEDEDCVITDRRRRAKSTHELAAPGHGSAPKHAKSSSENNNQSMNYQDETKLSFPGLYPQKDEVPVRSNVNDLLKLNIRKFTGYLPTCGEKKNDSDFMDSVVSADVEYKDTQRKDDQKKPPNESSAGVSVAENIDTAQVPFHLPKKQRELFLRIQQQQREAESCQDGSGEQDSETDSIKEERWYSSDDEEDSLSNVLKTLSHQKPNANLRDGNESTKSVFKAKTGATKAPGKGANSTTMLPDFSKSITKLLSNINQTNATANSTPSSSSTDMLEAQQTVVTNAVRDPRMSCVHRNRSSAMTSTAAVKVATAATPQDTTKNALAAAFEAFQSVGPSATKHSVHQVRGRPPTSAHPSINCNTASTFRAGLEDVDLRSFFPASLETGDVDLRLSKRSDVDLRTEQATLAFCDTDMRVGFQDLHGVQAEEACMPNSDVDLRMLRSAPVQAPAAEIDASLASHPPMPYALVTAFIPQPDYTNFKFSVSDPQVQSDPRLQKIFRLYVPAKVSKQGASPPSDPRRQSSRNSAESQSFV